MMQVPVIMIMLISLMAVIKPPVAAAAESGWHEVGTRMGFQEGTRDEYFHHYQLFAVYCLPAEWRGTSGWGVGTYVETAIGVLQSVRESGFIGSVGPGLSFNKSGKGVAVDLGINVNIMDRKKFAKQNFGSIVMFGAGLGVSYLFENGIKFEYKIEHISNGHILYSSGTPNPGLDSHMIGASLNF